MGAGPQHPYPKWVWSPTGGWYSQPKAWKTNTFIMATAMAGAVALIWKFSAEKEWRYQQPTGWIPSMMWARQYRNKNQVEEAESTSSSQL
ncbi:hypothetical protein BKA69DRAFT_64549 [Paraphysoderma sedebokerense]|nr:hypothetical protein BKA69DRAFT_64549 [Paraphysoderma sedebokerense]